MKIIFFTKVITFLFPFLGSLFLTSCGELTGKNTGATEFNNPSSTSSSNSHMMTTVGGIHALKLTTDNNNNDDDSYILSGAADNGGNSSHNYRLRFALPEGETLKFYFFSSKILTDGIEFSFTRSSGIVKFQLNQNKKFHRYEFASLNSHESNIVDVDIDIHNDHTDTHILVWGHSGPHDDNEECTFEDGCLYNSEDFALDTWLGVGRASGSNWGFRGNKDLILILEGPQRALSDA